MSMTISKVLILLDSWAADADGRVLTAPDAFAVVTAHQRAGRYRAMTTAIRDALAAGQVPAVVSAKRPARKAAKTRVMTAPEFWEAHALAKAAIMAVYGQGWACAAPIGETLIVTLPARILPSARGTRLGRFPAARYWPGGVLPDGIEVHPDYPRVSAADYHRAHGRAAYAAKLRGDAPPWGIDDDLDDDLAEAAD
jgi:hypothetical protein